MTNKNSFIGIIAIVVIAGGAFLLFINASPSVVDTSVLGVDESELVAFQADLDSFAGDEAVLRELDQTFGDVAGVTGIVSTDEALDSASISQEANDADISKDLAGFNSDDAQLQELNQVFGEVSQ